MQLYQNKINCNELFRSFAVRLNYLLVSNSGEIDMIGDGELLCFIEKCCTMKTALESCSNETYISIYIYVTHL